MTCAGRAAASARFCECACASAAVLRIGGEPEQSHLPEGVHDAAVESAGAIGGNDTRKELRLREVARSVVDHCLLLSERLGKLQQAEAALGGECITS